MSNLSHDQDNGAVDESQQEDDETSSSESNSGFSTGTSASEGGDDDGGVSASSSHSDEAIRSGHPPMPDPPTDDDRPTAVSTDYSVVRGEFGDDEEDQEAETSTDPLLGSIDEGSPYTDDDNVADVDGHGLDSRSAEEPHRSIDLTYSTPPRVGLHQPLSESGANDVEEEHEIVFEASEQPDEPELFPPSLPDPDHPCDADDKQQTTEDNDNVTQNETTTTTTARDRRSRFSAGAISRIFAPRQQHAASSESVAPPTGVSETDALVVPSGSPPEVPQSQTPRRWLPFSGRRSTKRPSTPTQAGIVSPSLGDSEENVPLNEAITSPVDTVASPSRTEPISEASDSPAQPMLHRRGYFGRRRRENVPPSPNDIIAEPSTARVLFSGASPKKSNQHVEDQSPEGDSANELDDTSTLGIAVSVRTLFIAGVALTLVVILSTIGTSFLGAELALRGNTLGTNLESSYRPNGGSNTTHQNSTDAPQSIRRDICEGSQLLLEFEIKFDSQPAEVGIALRDSGPFGGASLWAFDAFSFRSFTQFLRTNVFSICLPPEPTYEFEITDAFGNGLASTFGTSTLVYGQWTLSYNSSIVASYEGNCNATREGDAVAKFSPCGSYCRCSYRFSSNESTGNCSTNCTRR
jgi:hypothetical protein